jgi:NADH dehydrogenase/NADH:ubiquinone oxidoreductase subunit G
MGVCFDCLVQVDAQPNVQACMVTVKTGMRIHLQRGARPLEPAG